MPSAIHTFLCALFSFNFRTHTTKILLINLIEKNVIFDVSLHTICTYKSSLWHGQFGCQRATCTWKHSIAFGDQPTIFSKLHNAPESACNVHKLHAHICKGAFYCNNGTCFSILPWKFLHYIQWFCNWEFFCVRGIRVSFLAYAPLSIRMSKENEQD